MVTLRSTLSTQRKTPFRTQHQASTVVQLRFVRRLHLRMDRRARIHISRVNMEPKHARFATRSRLAKMAVGKRAHHPTADLATTPRRAQRRSARKTTLASPARRRSFVTTKRARADARAVRYRTPRFLNAFTRHRRVRPNAHDSERLARDRSNAATANIAVRSLAMSSNATAARGRSQPVRWCVRRDVATRFASPPEITMANDLRCHRWAPRMRS
jgi:hypothetical protein